MILDCLRDREHVFQGPAWDVAFEFLATLDAASEEREYSLHGKEVFAIISSYETRPLAAAALEAHRQYADIQMILSGKERMLWQPGGGLEVRTPYDASKDITFFHFPAEPASAAELTLSPGVFAVFFPKDAHAPGLCPAGAAPASVKKVVVKIKTGHIAAPAAE